MNNLDEIDLKILELLQKNAKLTTSEIAEVVGLSKTPTFERIRRLEKDGYIKSYSAVLSAEQLGFGITVFCMITLVNQSKETFMQFEKQIHKIPEVVSMHSVTGPYGYILKIVTQDIKSYNKFIVEKISRIEAIGRYESMVALDVIKDSYTLPIINYLK